MVEVDLKAWLAPALFRAGGGSNLAATVSGPAAVELFDFGQLAFEPDSRGEMKNTRKNAVKIQSQGLSAGKHMVYTRTILHCFFLQLS